jgi:hypothetical protein
VEPPVHATLSTPAPWDATTFVNENGPGRYAVHQVGGSE